MCGLDGTAGYSYFCLRKTSNIADSALSMALSTLALPTHQCHGAKR